jgi:hypothetical protein
MPRPTLDNSPQGGSKVGTLEEQARKKFTDPPLSAAEERVVRAAPDGSVADCRGDLGGGSNPENANGTGEAPDETWPETRNVRADLIRWLCVDSGARRRVDPRGVRILGARIKGRLDLRFTNILFPIFLVRCRLEESLELRSAKMPALSLEGSWTRAIGADELKLEGSLYLMRGFHAEGEVRLVGATIGGGLIAEGGTFKNLNQKEYALIVDRAEVAGSVFLSDGFRAEGEVRLVGTTIGGNLSAGGGTFRKPEGMALNADRIKVHGSVSLRRRFAADGVVRLHGAEVDGQLQVLDAWLDRLDLDSARITGPFLWQNIHKDRKDYKDRHPDFPDKEWKPSLDLTDAKTGALADQSSSWPEKERLFLDGFVYDRIDALPDEKATIDASPVDAATAAAAPTAPKARSIAKERLRWLRLQPEAEGYTPQPYEQLIAVLRQMGHEHQVAKIAIAKQKDLRKRGNLGLLGWIRSWFLYFAVGYGYRAWLAFVWLSLLIVVGSCVFSRAYSANVLVPSEQAAYMEYENSKMVKLSPPYPRFQPLLYSLDVILPFDLGQKSHWRLYEKSPDTLACWKYEFYSLFQLFAGWALLIVAAAVPAGLIKKD